MRSFQDTFETRKRSLIRTFSTRMTVPLRETHVSLIMESKNIRMC